MIPSTISNLHFFLCIIYQVHVGQDYAIAYKLKELYNVVLIVSDNVMPNKYDEESKKHHQPSKNGDMDIYEMPFGSGLLR